MKMVLRLSAAVAVAVAMLGSGIGLTVVAAANVRAGIDAGAAPDVKLQPLAQRSVILAADGSLLSTLYEEDRRIVPLAQIPEVVRHAVVAVEDAAFFDHAGVSLPGVARALRANIEAGAVDQGGSTITQQLIKQRVLGDDRSMDRKLREALLAVRLEEELDKEEILERYLNTVYFGQGAHGVHAAAERFFGKALVQLTVAEAALLAGVIASPETYDPFRHPAAARERRDHAIDRLLTEGYIDVEQAEEARRAPLPERPHRIAAQPDDHFSEEVRRQLLADPRLGATAAERQALVFRGGLRVHTTLDPRLQQLAEAAVAAHLPSSPFTAALVAIDPADGSVRALVGGPDFGEAKFNLATQGARQAGSSFKTIALAAWLADGRSPEDVVELTAPCELPMPPPSAPWRVDNYDGGSGATRTGTLREATIRSQNCAYARLALALGPEKLAAMAHRLGVRRQLPPVPSIVLGSGEVSPLEMASVYATLAADGVRHQPTFIRRVEAPDGRVVLENVPAPERVLDAEVARSVTDVLRQVVTSGTGTAADIGRPVAGKTGTAQEWRDAWFAGYGPQLAAAVWMGHPDGQIPMVGVAGRNVTGGSYPAQIWAAFMGPALAPLPVVDFAPPDRSRWPAPSTIGGAPPAATEAPPPASPQPPPGGGAPADASQGKQHPSEGKRPKERGKND